MDGRRPPEIGEGIRFIHGKGSVLMSSMDGCRSSSRLIDGKVVKVDSCDQDLGGVRRNLSGEGAGDRPLGPLVIKEGCLELSKKVVFVEGKGKDIVDDEAIVSPVVLSKISDTNPVDLAATSSKMNIYVNRFGNSNAISSLSHGINANVDNSVNRSVKFLPSLDSGGANLVDKINDTMPVKELAEVDGNPWKRKPYTRLDFNEDDQVFAEDGKTVKLVEDKEVANSQKLRNSLIIKGRGWFLCSFESTEMMEGVLSGGPWFVNGSIVGMEKWSLEFSTLSLKGLTSPIWIRMPHLPLQCWDEVNVARIASSIGTWVESISGKFYQRFEYEKILTLCYGCGMVGHLKPDCRLKAGGNSGTKMNIGVSREDKEVGEVQGENSDHSYGPWIMVKKKLNRKTVIQKEKPIPVKKYDKVEDIIADTQLEEGEIPGEEEEAATGRDSKWLVNSAVEVADSIEAPSKIIGVHPISGRSVAAESVKGCEGSLFTGRIEKEVGSSGDMVKRKLAKELRALGHIKINSRGRSVDGVSKKKGLLETKISSMEKELFVRMMGLGWDYFILPSEGLSGGIMILWRSDSASFSVLKTLDQCVNGDLNVFNKGVWMIYTVYANKEMLKRRHLWEVIQEASNRDIPSIAGGDFNCILAQEDKKGGRRFKINQGSLDMLKFMNENDYHEVGFVGPRYTWCNNKSGGGRILERLDRCILNSLAINKIQISLVRHLARVASDHCPIVLKMFETMCKGRSGMKFEDTWLSFKTAEHIVSSRWKKPFLGDVMEVLNKNCKKVLKDLFYWSKARLKNFSLEKDKLKAEILGLQEEESRLGWLNEDKLWLLKAKVKQLNVVLNNLNTWWRQRAKAKWIKDGDANTKFFHSFANSRRNVNWISQVKDANGVLSDNPGTIEEVFMRFFQVKWKSWICSFDGWPKLWASLLDSDKNLLNRELDEAEISEVILNLENIRAPGLDGISYSFFKAFWKIIRVDVVRAVQQIFHTSSMNRDWKDTLFMLIPKSSNPSIPSAYHPISLCNSIYKIVAKILLNRMVEIMPRIISEEQAAFVKGRSISDHLLLAQEVFNKLRFSKVFNGFLAIKVDMEQAYDSMCWSTLERMLIELGFPSRLVHLVMDCIIDPRFSIVINGSNSGWIEGKSGFHQGCPLSPFLFLLCSQLLSNAFRSRGNEVDIRISTNAQRISHLLFADDILLFLEAKENVMKKVRKIMEDYCRWTGQNINYHKSSLVCGNSVDRRRRMQISRFMGIKLVDEFEYLGIKLALRCLRKADFQGLFDKSFCKPKEYGGWDVQLAVARRDAMRAKLAWKLIDKPESMLSRQLNAKYGANWWKYQLYGRSSCTWKILFSGWNALRELVRWKVADGDEDVTLDCFIMDGCWDRVKLSQFFGTDLMNLICKVQISPSLSGDSMELRFKMSRKSISALIMEDKYKNMGGVVPLNWVYKLKLNARLEVFLWRLFLDALPTADFLFRRNLADDSLCPLGCEVLEDINHITTNCCKLRKVLDVLRGWGFEIPIYSGWFECLAGLKQLINGNLMLIKMYFTIIWFVWNPRNKVKHGNPEESNVFIAISILSFINQDCLHIVQLGNWVVNQSFGLSFDKWQPPPLGWIKINLDASLKGNYEAGIGGIVRDCKGRFLVAFGRKKLHWDRTQLEMAAIADLKEVLHGRFDGVEGIIVEGDNKNVIDILHNVHSIPKNMDRRLVIEDSSFLNELNKVIFHWVNRSYNRLTDFCANYAFSYDFLWDLFCENDLPSSFCNMVKEDCVRVLHFQ
ncbi:hypothetical protein KFK09_028414 [Dendrobium nobile]|uniref:Reverse transcriptase n=1 Tax=Dendrobium nobile TaxID=94219 RepID=A0A8T3A2J7_DENNO|nr:hypothetical protein KFK09_028414 [Dendrobium nobile]